MIRHGVLNPTTCVLAGVAPFAPVPLDGYVRRGRARGSCCRIVPSGHSRRPATRRRRSGRPRRFAPAVTPTMISVRRRRRIRRSWRREVGGRLHITCAVAGRRRAVPCGDTRAGSGGVLAVGGGSDDQRALDRRGAPVAALRGGTKRPINGSRAPCALPAFDHIACPTSPCRNRFVMYLWPIGARVWMHVAPRSGGESLATGELLARGGNLVSSEQFRVRPP